MKIKLSLKKTVDENAGEYYQKAKKAKKKIQGAQKTVDLMKIRLEREKLTQKKQLEKQKRQQEEKARKKKWFEKFKWFYTSNGYLVIAGRDSSTNEEVVKKHAESDDLVFHTELPSSPFTVIKNGKKSDDIDKTEAAQFTACHGKAWDMGLKRSEVFYVEPSQLSKTPKSGEYISKGSFIVTGKRNFITVTIDLAATIKDHVVMIAPPSAAKQGEKVIKIEQGNLKKGEASNKIMKKLGLTTNDDILKNLPNGRFKI